MKLECSLERMKEVVPVVERITGKQTALPAISSILMVANGKSLKLRATNLDLGIEVEIPANIKKEGMVLVPGAVFSSLVSALYNSKMIALEEVNGNLKVASQHHTATIKCHPAGDFPSLPMVKGATVTIEAHKFTDGLKSVSYAAALSDMKPELSSVYVHEDKSDIVFVATDSFRLAEKRLKIKKTLDLEGVLIPIKNAVEMIRVFERADGDLSVSVAKNQISISHNGIYLTSRIIDGDFPDYRQIIPKEHSTLAVVLKQDLQNALKTTTVFSGKFNEVVLTVEPKEKNLSLSASHQDLGEERTVLEGAIEGASLSVAFNHRYLSDCMGVIGDESISLSSAGASRPLVVRGAHDTSFLYLVMPLNR